MNDSLSLAELMKAYEHDYRRRVEPTDYVLLRLDGKAFHSYTKKLARPYDASLMEAMDRTLLALCDELATVRFGYVESDEISLLLTGWRWTEAAANNPPEKKMGELWMGGVEAKMLSLSAAVASVAFNSIREEQYASLTEDIPKEDFHRGPALFDSRLWTFPGTDEGRELVQKYFGWRRRDSVKNSVTMAALKHFSHRELMKVTTEEKCERLEAIGEPWEALPLGFRFGRTAHRVTTDENVTYVDKRTQKVCSTRAKRRRWALKPAEELTSLWNDETLPRP